MGNKKIRARFEMDGPEPTEFTAEAVVALGYDGDGTFAFTGGHITPYGIGQIVKAGVDEFVRIMTEMGADEEEARGQVMIAALMPCGVSDSIVDIDLATRDEIRKIAREMGVDAEL